MKAVDAKLLDMLNTSNQFQVPIYQRTYAWSQDEAAQLWDDVMRTGESQTVKTHFTGSVVYVERGVATLTSAEPNLLIDGQQRVTTVTLILAALAEFLETLPKAEQEPVDGFSPKKIRKRYLVNDDEEDERRYKLVLSQSDKQALFAVVDGREPEESLRNSRVWQNFRYFTENMPRSKERLVALCLGLSRLVVVDIKLERGQDDPQLVFESMNSTGKKLSQADLIRNFVLMGLSNREQKRLYRDYWRPMEVEFGAEAYEQRFDNFVRDYLTVITGSIPRQRDVYEAFKQYTYGQRNNHNATQEDLVRLMREHSKRYCAIAIGKETDPALYSAFAELEQMRADVVYPFLLEVYTDYDAGKLEHREFLDIIYMVTAYVFRRAVCRVPTNSMNKTFAGLSKTLRKDRYLDSVKALLLSLKTYRSFPTDAEFEEALTSADLYNFPRRSYLLRKLENYGRKEPVRIEEYTIEHILPQNPNLSRHWKEALGDDWQAKHERYLHTLGNLTLTGYNSEYSDLPFDQKRDMDGGFRESPIRLNEGLGNLESWGVDEISARASRIAENALRIWARPTLDQDVKDELTKAPKKSAYSIEDHPELLTEPRRELFERLRAEVQALDPDVTCEFLKIYVAFKAETNFVDVVPQRRRMCLSLNIPIESLVDDRGVARDVTGRGRWGNGPTEVSLNEESDFTYVMGLVRQAYEYQMGDV